MKISDQIGLAARNLTRRKGRTALTVIGVVVGTCAVIVMISLGIATNKNQEEMLASWGDLTQVQIWGGGGMVSNGSLKTPPSLNDAAIARVRELDHVVTATPYQYGYSYTFNAKIEAGRNDRYNMTVSSNVVGVYPDALVPMGFKLTDGNWLSDDASYGKNKIPVLVGANAAYNFIDSRRSANSPRRRRYAGQTDANGNPIPPFVDVDTQTMKITISNNDSSNPKTESWDLVVVGKLVEDSAKGWWTRDAIVFRLQDLQLIEQEYNKLIRNRTNEQRTYEEVYVKVDDVDNVEKVTEDIHALGFTDTYSISDQREQMQAQVVRNQLMLGGLAAISLLVAALNIANTMTMAIYERTREIGVMKVLGCELGNIRRMFLLESACIGFVGGVIGSVLGLGISFILNHLTDILLFAQEHFGTYVDISQMFGDGFYYMGDSTTLSIVPLWLILAALAFATGIGLLSGIAPANRAVGISALEAIRHD